MLIKKLLLVFLVLYPLSAFAWCGPIILSGWYPMPGGPGAVVPLTWLYSDYRWNAPGYALNGSFQNTVPEGTTVWITQMMVSDKGLPDWNGSVPYNRNSYFVLGSIFTCTNRMGICSFNPPLAVPAGYQFDMPGNAVIDNSNDGGGNNFIAVVNGFARDQTCPYPQRVRGIPAGW